MTRSPCHAPRLLCALLLAVPCLALAPSPGVGQEDGAAAALTDLATYRAAEGLRVELFAADPQLNNPVALCLDELNRVYVAEEYRFNRGTEENRTRPFLLEDDLQIETLDDRLRMFERHADQFEGGMAWFRRWGDQVRQLADTDGDGRADRSTVFAGPFNEPLDGLASGVLARDGDIYLTCVPHLWRLRDRDDDGRADEQQRLLTGFGVNAGFLGHDLHGLVWGPDGRLYFSIGDRGFHVVTPEGRVLHGPRTGAVFRCEPDGSRLEVVHRGLRNPQELAFDDDGRLLAVDNNCDKGDDARLVLVVEGGDSGWNMSYQSLPEPYLTGPWHAEHIWRTPGPAGDTSDPPLGADPQTSLGAASSEPPAWIVPPVGRLGAGPSGFTFCSGVGLPERYRDCLLYCNYTGNGGVEAFRLVPEGAGVRMADLHDWLKPVRATDVELGYDGQVYVCDFGPLDWSGATVPGRVFRVFDEQRRQSPEVRELRQLFAYGFSGRSDDELLRLLGHADLRARQRAQFELVGRPGAERLLARLAKDERAPTRSRLHAIWGLGQLARRDVAVGSELLPLLADGDEELRAEAARTLGDARCRAAAEALLLRLEDDSPAVRMRAAFALGRVLGPNDVGDFLGPDNGAPPDGASGPIVGRAAAALFTMAAANGNREPFVRHAAVMALTWLGDRDTVLARLRAPSRAERLVALLVLRRWRDVAVADALDDSDLSLVAEAARAINDLPLDDVAERLASVRPREGASFPDSLARRVVNASFRRGGAAADATRLVELALDERLSPAARRECLAALGDWAQPAARDRVTGFWRPLAPRTATPARDAVAASLDRLLRTDESRQADVVELLIRLEVVVDETELASWVVDGGRPAAARAAALRLLAALDSGRLPAVLAAALGSDQPTLRAAARREICARDAARGVELVAECLANADAVVAEQQAAFVLLGAPGGVAAADAAPLVATWLRRLESGDAPPQLALEIVEAAERLAQDGSIAALLSARRARVAAAAATDPLAAHRVALEGGDPQRGRSLFVNHATAQCVRCHRVAGDAVASAGGVAGPDLSRVAERHPRESLLESLLYPDAKIAAGFGAVSLRLESGEVLSGILQAEDAARITLRLADGATRDVPLDAIERRGVARSPMPPLARNLGLAELRDLIAFLDTLRAANAAPGGK